MYDSPVEYVIPRALRFKCIHARLYAKNRKNLKRFYCVVVEINGCEFRDLTRDLGWRARLGGVLACNSR